MYEAPGGAFGCRRCLRGLYGGQRDNEAVRAIQRAIKIRMHLGGSPDLSQPFPNRPKRTSKATYAALRAEAFRLQAASPVAWCTVPAQKPSRVRVRKAES